MGVTSSRPQQPPPSVGDNLLSDQLDDQRVKIIGMNGDCLAVVPLLNGDTVGAIRRRAAMELNTPLTLMLGDRVLQNSEDVSGVGIQHETDLVGLCSEAAFPGFTRICHSDIVAKRTTGSAMNWDMPIRHVVDLAQRAKCVRIQGREDPAMAVTSLPNTHPIVNLRNTNFLNYGVSLTHSQVGQTWKSDCPSLLRNLSHDYCMNESNMKQALASHVYWAGRNGNGLHWERDKCKWNYSEQNVDLELYVDVHIWETYTMFDE